MQVYDPTAPGPEATQNLRRSVADLKGKVVGFIDNSKPNFNLLADDLAALLISRAHCTGASGLVRKTNAIPSPVGSRINSPFSSAVRSSAVPRTI